MHVRSVAVEWREEVAVPNAATVQMSTVDQRNRTINSVYGRIPSRTIKWNPKTQSSTIQETALLATI